MRLILLVALAIAQAGGPTLRQRMLAAEDARVATDAAIGPLLEGLRSGDAVIVARAARGLGRFERPAFVKHLLPLLQDPRPGVRREAANALGQSLSAVPRAGDTPPPAELAAVTRALLARIRTERDTEAVGALAQALGRLPHRSAAAVREVEEALRGWLTTLGAFRGLETLIRLNQKLQPPDTATMNALRTAATLGGKPASPEQVASRRVAWLAITAAGAVDLDLVQRGAADPDFQTRRLALASLVGVKATVPERRDVLLRALKDESFHVRLEAVRVYARTVQPADCTPLIVATDDANAHVAIAAIDALGAGCVAGPNPRARLMILTDGLQASAAGRWHLAAHALVSLARTSREEATTRLGRFIDHASPFVRVYAARAAAALGAIPRLERLAADSSDNVRYEALIALRRLRGHDADALFVDALSRPDYQLILAAAQALEGSPTSGAVPALLQTFARLTAEQRETSRDPRLALLGRLRELGSSAHASALQVCLTDIDPQIAAECSATLQAWTSVRRTPQPSRPTATPIPESLPERARLTMRGGRSFELTLFADEAPASVFRFASLARAGYYDGLTFHRIVANFIIQGGSPGANEYAGDGPFMRDELGLRSHTRGTVGISTRGRDTGDAQIFVNLLDNPRLDHEFTVFAEVVSGMEVVDGVLEGDVIDRVEILESPAPAR